MTPSSAASLVTVKPPVAKMPAYRLVSRVSHPEDTVVRVGDVPLGTRRVVVMAGPCAVEDRQQLLEAAWCVRETGGSILRGGAYKPRTSPYDFQGLGEAGLELLAEAREATGLPVITEVTDSEDVELVARYVDCLQIGSRNMSAFRLLRRAAQSGKPIMLKRGYQATIREWLLAAEYILSEGNPQVILCERGIRTYDAEYTRNTLDLNAVPVLNQETHLPVVVDPSHGTGRADLVATMARGAVAVGADGLMIETHPRPSEALCDGKQSVDAEELANLMLSLRPLASLMGRTL